MAFRFTCFLLASLLLLGCAPAGTPTPISTNTPAGATPTIAPLPAITPTSAAGTVPAPEFPAGLDWLNVAHPLTLADLRGKVVLLDFWTYGCINCIHIIPDLKHLEEKYGDQLVVIGVHSAKFENEGDTENIRRIVQRYELSHPIINDKDFVIWNSYGATAWPTLVLIDPAGNVVGYHAGEGVYGLFDPLIGSLISEFAGRLDSTPLQLVLERDSLANSPLLFPGKVLADEPGNRLFIADSNHNRIVISDLAGNVQAVVGAGPAGLRDGDYETAQFFRPQGLTLADENTLYVADSENQAIRKVDLSRRLVETVAGNGRQLYMQISYGPAKAISLNSPWDVLFANELLYIAMAGQHQIWVYDPATESLRLHAGSGREELRDGPLMEAGFNQPSGLASDGRFLYVADSEASAIRAVTLDPAGGVATIVGVGLFDFGDVDGFGEQVRLQHPLGVAVQGNLLYVADSYNSKIKLIDPKTGQSTTFVGGPAAGWQDGPTSLFAEPGGLSLSSNNLYVADTNNHVIRVVDLVSKMTQTLVLVDSDGLLTRRPAGDVYPGQVVTLEGQMVGAGPGQIQLEIVVPAGYKLNDLAPFSMSWDSETIILPASEQSLVAPAFPLDLAATFPAGESLLSGDLVIYYCQITAQSLCFIEQVRLIIPLSATNDGSHTLPITYTIPAPQN